MPREKQILSSQTIIIVSPDEESDGTWSLLHPWELVVKVHDNGDGEPEYAHIYSVHPKPIRDLAKFMPMAIIRYHGKEVPLSKVRKNDRWKKKVRRECAIKEDEHNAAAPS